MDTALMRRIVADYVKEISARNASTGESSGTQTIYPESAQELSATLSAAGIRIRREEFVSVLQKITSLEQLAEHEISEDWDLEDPKLLDALKQLAGHWLPERLLADEVADVVHWLELHFPDRAEEHPTASAGTNSAERATDAAPGPATTAKPFGEWSASAEKSQGLGAAQDRENVQPEPETVTAAVAGILEWLTLGPLPVMQRYRELECLCPEVGLILENTLSHLVHQRPSDALALAERLAKLTDLTFDWGLYADLLAERGQVAQAEAIYARNIEREPWNVYHPKNLSYLLVRHGQPSDRQRALVLLDEAEKLSRQRLEAVTAGQVVPLPSMCGLPTPGVDEDDDERVYSGYTHLDEVYEELSNLLDEQLALATLLGDAGRVDQYQSKIAQLEQLRAELALGDDDEADGFDDDGSVDNVEEQLSVAMLSPVPRTEVGRNDPCPCGSGKKYKQCCWLRS